MCYLNSLKSLNSFGRNLNYKLKSRSVIRRFKMCSYFFIYCIFKYTVLQSANKYNENQAEEIHNTNGYKLRKIKSGIIP